MVPKTFFFSNNYLARLKTFNQNIQTYRRHLFLNFPRIHLNEKNNSSFEPIFILTIVLFLYYIY